jgi:hypothetical protein
VRANTCKYVLNKAPPAVSKKGKKKTQQNRRAAAPEN